MQFITGLLIILLGYVCGSLPFSLWITRLLKGIDVRDGGSGHATTTNTIRQAGWGAGALVLLLDISKGFLPVWIALNYAKNSWVLPMTVAAVVAGHCWPLFARFRGGMGLAPTGGGLMAMALIPAFACLALLIALTLLIKHSARAALFTGLLLGPLYYFMGVRGDILWAAIAAGLVLAIRFYSDWRREYQELWLDREQN